MESWIRKRVAGLWAATRCLAALTFRCAPTSSRVRSGGRQPVLGEAPAGRANPLTAVFASRVPETQWEFVRGSDGRGGGPWPCSAEVLACDRATGTVPEDRAGGAGCGAKATASWSELSRKCSDNFGHCPTLAESQTHPFLQADPELPAVPRPRPADATADHAGRRCPWTVDREDPKRDRPTSIVTDYG